MKIDYSQTSVLLVFILCGDGVLGVEDTAVLARKTRGVVFPSGGTFKLVIGLGTPIKLSKTRTITVGWNFQWQYPLAVNTSVIENYPPILSRKIRDDSDFRRQEIYEAIEFFLTRQNMYFKDCLVRYICEEAFSTFKHSFNQPYGDLLNIILSAENEDDMDQRYIDARQAGSFGVDCRQMYPDCQEDLLMNGLFSLDFT